MDATLILIHGDAAMEFERSHRRRSAGGASAPGCRVRGNEMATPAAERRRFDPPPYGPARFNALGETVFRGRKIKMRVRGADGKAQIGTFKGAI
jgi:hypothetical protein